VQDARFQVQDRWATRRARAPWSFRELLAVVGLGIVITIVVVILGIIVAEALPASAVDELSTETGQVVLGGSAFYLSLGLATWLVIVRRKRLPWSSLGFVSVRPRILLTMIPAGFGLLILNALLLAPVSFLLGLGSEERADEQQESFSPDGAGFPAVEYLGLFFLLAFVAPLIEELLFRGLLYGYLRGRAGVALSVIVSALVFAVLHVVIPPLFVMGAILAVLAERNRSLWPSIALHATNNGLIVIILAISSLTD
jgi:membrane protease YdiL (CAAX protease family)